MSLVSLASTILRRSAVVRFKAIPCNACYKLKQIQSYSSIAKKPVHEVNTKVPKDVMLFQYENPKFYQFMNIFAVVQYMFWSYLGVFAFKTLRDAPVDQTKVSEDTPWYRKINLGDNKYRNTLSAVSLFIGFGSLTVIWMFTLKSVRCLVLNKGGQHVTFVTYSPFGKNRMMKVPLECVSCRESRSLARVQLPLKVKNTMWHYILDMRGEFKNPLLFDATAGLGRKFTK